MVMPCWRDAKAHNECCRRASVAKEDQLPPMDTTSCRGSRLPRNRRSGNQRTPGTHCSLLLPMLLARHINRSLQSHPPLPSF